MRRILVPVDDSEPSSRALAHAIALAQRCGRVDIKGRVAETIVDHAAREGCDAIVLGIRGLGAVRGMALGSVVHLAQAPVTLVK